MQDWLAMTAADLGRGIGAGEIDPVDLAVVYLAAINAHPLRDKIYARVTDTRAMAEAEAASARAKAGLRRGPLDGVPVSWKDLYDTAGVGTEAGTAMMAGRVPEADAVVVRAATEAGMVCLGKTHLSEIAFSGLGYNPVTQTPPCVNDAQAVPGGSSSGAAASVAFDLAPMGIGSDTGGSIRLPSAWNDLVGFKPTHGTLSLDGVVALCASFDTVGPLCRSVEDAALGYAALGGAAVDLAGATLAGRRFAVIETVALDEVEAEPGAAFEDAVAKVQHAGAVVERIEVPCLRDAFALTAPLYPGEAYAEWAEYIEAAGDKMYARVFERILPGRELLAKDFIAAQRRLVALRAEFAREIAGYDAVLVPSCPILPPKLADIAEDAAFYVERNLKALRNTRIGNLMGLCGVSLPTGVPSCGLMMMGLAGRDAQVLRLSAAAERALA